MRTQPSAEIARVERARNAGESAIRPVPAQPSAEIVRVERAKCRRALATLQYNLSTRSNLWSSKLRTGDLVVQLVRGGMCGAGS